MARETKREVTEYTGHGGIGGIARKLMAETKAGISGREPEGVSPFEEKAQELMRRGEEAKGRQAPPMYGGGGPGSGETPIVSLQELPLRSKPRPVVEANLEWKQYRLNGEERRKPVKMNGAMINALALNLRAREWAKAMGGLKSKRHRQMENFEREAERWSVRGLGASTGKR